MLHSATSRDGLISAPHRLAAEAGRDVLADGGTAIEAMVAAAAAIAVVYPHMNAVGGDGFWLVHRPGTAPVAVRACGAAAGLATPAWYGDHGHAAIPARGPLAALTVAGTVSGWAAALGIDAPGGRRLPPESLLAAAVDHARNGIVVSASQARLTAEKRSELADAPGFADVYLPDGRPPGRLDVLRQPALADSLEQLGRAGLDDFYRGDLARLIAQGLERVGSPIRLGDLERHRARLVAPLSVDLRAGRIFNTPPPTQGVASLMILAIVERLAIDAPDGFAHVHGVVEATKRAFLLRDAQLGDPDAMAGPAASWLATDHVAAAAAAIDPGRAMPWPARPGDGDTIWMGAADRHGTVVSFIQSIFWEFGSGVVVPGTGILWQNRGAAFTLGEGPNRLAPGRLPFHTLNPALAHLADGRVMAYGTMGGDGQPQTQAAVFTRHATFGQGLQAAVTAPRWLLGRTWGAASTTLKLESRFPADLLDALSRAGHDVERVAAFDDVMGHAGAVVRHPGGVIEGAADPRSDGACAAL